MQSAIRVFSVFWALFIGILGFAPACTAAAHEPSHVTPSQQEGEGAAVLEARLNRILNRLESRRGLRQADARRMGTRLPSHSRAIPLVAIPDSTLEPSSRSGLPAQEEPPIPVLDASQPTSYLAEPSSSDGSGQLRPTQNVPQRPTRKNPPSIHSLMGKQGRRSAGGPAPDSATLDPAPSTSGPDDLAGKQAPLPPTLDKGAGTSSEGPGGHPLHLEGSAATSSLFAEPLRRMMRTRERRLAEAVRLGVTLPSQSGTSAYASEPLKKIAVTLTGMIERAPADSPINFGVYPG